MNLIEVVKSVQKKEFNNFPRRLYKNDPHWISPLDSETEAVFDPQKNAAFNKGEAIRWILIDDSGLTIGRIAAFIDVVRRDAYNIPVGGLGYFEVVEDYKAAKKLFDCARSWLTSKGIEAIDGPINFGENESNWGLLVEGHMKPTYGMPYNRKYYEDFFLRYGFKNYFDQYSYLKDIGSLEVFPERFRRIAEWISKRPGYSFEHFSFSNSSKYIDDIVEVYNATWTDFKEDFTPLDGSVLHGMLKKSKAFLDEELIWLAYHNNNPIAFFILYPDINKIFQFFNGKMGLLNILRFLILKRRKTMTKLRAAAAGVHPKYQNSGVESAIFLQLYNIFKKKPHYKELELSWVGDFNPKMISIYEAIGATRYKVHTTYRYLLDREAPFIRYKDEPLT
jgi:hypothetical protein